MVNRNGDATSDVLRHVHRYGLTLPNILHGARILPDADEDACLETLIELVKQGLLAIHDLYPGYRDEPYFHLTEDGAKHIAVSEKAAGQLPPKARKKCFAVAAFCNLMNTNRVKLTRDEFRTKFPELWYTGQPTEYYVEALPDGRELLGYFRPDLGGSGGWDNLLDSCSRFYTKRTSLQRTSEKYHEHVRAWQLRAEQGLFRIAVLTSQQDKVVRLWESVRMRELAGKWVAPVRVYLVPGLFDVLFPRPG